MSKHNGNFEVYGDIVVGANISGSKYTLPHDKGDTGEALIMDGGVMVFTNPAPYIDIAQTSGGAELVDTVNQLVIALSDVSGAIDNFVELFDTPKPALSVNAHEGEIIIVDPNASSQVQKIAYSGTTISDIFDFTTTTVAEVSGNLQSQIDSITTTIESSGGSILVTQIAGGVNLEVASAPIQDHNSLQGIQGNGGDYFHLDATQYANISGGVNQILTSSDGSMTVTPISGGGGYDLSSNIVAGDALCDGVNSTFQINHREIETRSDFPFVELDSSSAILSHRLFDRTSTSFKVEFSGVPSITSKILWHIHTFTSEFIPMRFVVDTTKTGTGSTAADHFKLPLDAAGTYDFTVDWGDGQTSNILSYNDAAIDHTYAAQGTYTVTILGECTHFKFNNTGDKLKVLDVTQWGNAVTSRLDFYGCTNLVALSATDSPVSVSLENCFRGCTGFNVDISHWDVSNVTDMSNMFYGATSFNNGANTDTNIVTGRSGLDGWDVGNVTNMYYMFHSASVFNLPLANWNVGKVTDMVAMLYGTQFNQPIGNWNMSSCKNIGYLFFGTPFNQDIGDWDVSNVEVAQAAFHNAQSFNQDLSKWNLGKCYDCYLMFGRAYAFNNGANTGVNPRTGRAGFDGWCVGADLADGSVSFQNFLWSNGSVMAFNRPIGNWNMRKAIRCDAMFVNCTSFNQDISGWDTSVINNMGYMFQSCTAFNQNIGAWNVGAVTIFVGMFAICTSFKQNLGAWNVSIATNLSNMFSGCDLNAPATSTNYDALLNGWASRPVVASRSFNAGTSKYGLGAVAARTTLTTAPNNWTVADGGAI